MRLARVFLPFFFCGVLTAGTLGVFHGDVVQSPNQQKRDGWIFVQSAKGMLREVDVSRAQVTYSEDVPANQRAKSAGADLVPGSEVTITAEQDDRGEWHAREVEIVRVSTQRASE